MVYVFSVYMHFSFFYRVGRAMSSVCVGVPQCLQCDPKTNDIPCVRLDSHLAVEQYVKQQIFIIFHTHLYARENRLILRPHPRTRVLWSFCFRHSLNHYLSILLFSYSVPLKILNSANLIKFLGICFYFRNDSICPADIIAFSYGQLEW